jgi:hypothetical protein
MADEIYINGYPVSTYLVPISLISGFIAPPTVVGSDYQIPGYVGVIPAPLGKGARTVTFGGLIAGVDAPSGRPAPSNARALYIGKLDAFSALVYNDGQPFTLRWTTDGASRTTTARYMSGLGEVAQVAPWAGRVAVDLLLINPYWA